MDDQLKVEVVPLSEIMQGDLMPVEKVRRVVLIVDDESVIAETLSIILSQRGYATFTAYDGESAIETARVIAPELLISDVMMPGMTGIELAIKLKKMVPDCEVLLFSGQAATQDLLQRASASGYDFDIMTKPVHPDDMLRRVRERLSQQTMVAAD